MFRRRRKPIPPTKFASMPTEAVMEATETAIMSSGHLFDSARRSGREQRSENRWHLDLLRTQLEQALNGVDELLNRSPG